ncbi:hypothetical protein EC991_002620 [Linnemannia zychae]|nr:hypothetical protein EC991_002620 [Linnemannia zychae]
MDPKPTTTTPAVKPKPPAKTPTNPTTTTTPPKKTTTGGAVLPPSSSSTAPSISPSASPDAGSSSSGGLPVGAIAGIAAGGALILMFLVSIFVCKKRRARRYAARPDGHDPSRDPIDPNDVLPLDNKYDQRTPTLSHSSAAAVGAAGAFSSNRSGNSRDGDSGFISYPLALRGASEDDKSRELAAYQDPRTQQTQRALEQEYSHYEYHIQSHYEPESPEMRPASLRPGPGPASPTKGPAQNNINSNINRAQHIPTPISTSPSMELSRNTPVSMSPSQRNFQHQQQQQQESSPLSPRSRPAHPLSSPSGPRGQDAVIVNDMGNEFVIQTSSNNSRHDSFEQDGSVVQSELSYRRGVPPRKSQDSNLGGGSAPPSGSLQYPASGTPSPIALGPQRGPGSGGRPGPGPGSNSTFSSPRQGPSGYSSPPVRPSQYQPQHQYQPPPQGYQQQQQQPYQQYPQDPMNGYGSPPMRPQQPRQQGGGGGGYPGPGGPGGPGGMRSPPMSPQSRGPGGYSPHMGPSYPQQQYQPQSNYSPQQQSGNYRPRTNNSNY